MLVVAASSVYDKITFVQRITPVPGALCPRVGGPAVASDVFFSRFWE
jgi:hypothetical protein